MEQVDTIVLVDIQRELEKPEPDLMNVYDKWTKDNFNNFALAVVRLKKDRYIFIPGKDIVFGGDKYIPEDIIIDNIKITRKGKNLLEKQGLL